MSLSSPTGRSDARSAAHLQFETKISTGRKLLFGVASVLGSADQIQCFACGTKYERG